MTIRSNPAWTNTILKTAFQRIAAVAPKSALPISGNTLDERTGKMKRGWKEYGTGHYGTVFPTNSPDIVMKITSDPTEAAFVAAYLSITARELPIGIVGYHAVVQIAGVTKSKRPVYVIWRDEAQCVGDAAINRWLRSRSDNYLQRSYDKSISYLHDAKVSANKIRTLLKKPVATSSGQRRRADLIERGLEDFETATSSLQSEPMGNYVGEALATMVHHGLLLADVHVDNIGFPNADLAEQIGETCIITDPGHAVALDNRYAGLKIQEI